MRSLRELQSELLNVRAKPTTVSEWYDVITVEERVRRLLVDAIGQYNYPVRGVLYSQTISGMPVTIALPKNVSQVEDVIITGHTTGTASRTVVGAWSHLPTPQTNLLVLEDSLFTWSLLTTPLYYLEIRYSEDSRDVVLPPDVTVRGTLNTQATGFGVDGGTPDGRWSSPGYMELTHPVDATDAREIIHYDLALPTGFTGLSRAVEGGLSGWTEGDIVSYAIPAPNRALPVWLKAAQGSLYDALIADRAFYDKYNAIASEQASPPERLAGLSRTFEDKAERAYRKGRRLPPPTRSVRKFRR